MDTYIHTSAPSPCIPQHGIALMSRRQTSAKRRTVTGVRRAGWCCGAPSNPAHGNHFWARTGGLERNVPKHVSEQKGAAELPEMPLREGARASALAGLQGLDGEVGVLHSLVAVRGHHELGAAVIWGFEDVVGAPAGVRGVAALVPSMAGPVPAELDVEDQLLGQIY